MRIADITNSEVQKFCASINPDTAPVLLRINPAPKGQILDCFHIVSRLVSEYGGNMILGWSVTEFPNAFLEAEHHAVFQPANDVELIDVTPPQTKDVTSRVFVRDDKASFDRSGRRRNNKWHALVEDPIIFERFEVSNRINELESNLPGYGRVSAPPSTARKLFVLKQEQHHLIMQIGMKYTSKNARCFCGSGRKFKHCHA